MSVMSASEISTRWKPPSTAYIRGSIFVAASIIFSIPGCEQPTTRTPPLGVLITKEDERIANCEGAVARVFGETRRTAAGNYVFRTGGLGLGRGFSGGRAYDEQASEGRKLRQMALRPGLWKKRR